MATPNAVDIQRKFDLIEELMRDLAKHGEETARVQTGMLVQLEMRGTILASILEQVQRHEVFLFRDTAVPSVQTQLHAYGATLATRAWWHTWVLTLVGSVCGAFLMWGWSETWKWLHAVTK